MACGGYALGAIWRTRLAKYALLTFLQSPDSLAALPTRSDPGGSALMIAPCRTGGHKL
jgi:hypothetical protein